MTDDGFCAIADVLRLTRMSRLELSFLMTRAVHPFLRQKVSSVTSPTSTTSATSAALESLSVLSAVNVIVWSP
jgi:hypothetical protein